MPTVSSALLPIIDAALSQTFRSTPVISGPRLLSGGSEIYADARETVVNTAPTSVSPKTDAETALAAAVRGTCAGDQHATAELFRLLSRGLRWYILRRTHRDDAEDILHTVWVDFVLALQRGQLRDPEAALGYARIIAIRHCCNWVKNRVKARMLVSDDYVGANITAEDNLDNNLLRSEQRAVMVRALETLKPLDREILERFYVREQDAETIQRELTLTDTQFRLRKTRAKQKLTEKVGRFTAGKATAARQTSTIEMYRLTA
jgi:RNA polymerase sigma-70 factor, ECF subfamily